MTVGALKQLIDEIPMRDYDADIFYGGKLITDLWWIDCADGYVFGLETKGEDNERD